ncbi:MAG TPA: hypothetical protein VFW13_15155, partial [Phenylobacterium sp.]|nr:hypothetical protein [Phenylobacterium sp.]
EALNEGVTGEIATTDDPQRLADRLLRLLADNGLRETARLEGPAFVQRDFGLDRMLDETLALYQTAGAGAVA